MQRHFKRLALALVTSVTGFVLTLGWYYAGNPKRRVGPGHDSVARLTETTDEVQRRETTRVIWETISLNDDLFAGEAVRTSAHASAKLQLKSGAVIHLDPDSLVVLEQNATGISLDFLEGNLFVQGNGAKDTGVTLKTGRGEIAVNGSDLSLSKKSGGEVDLEVFRGSAELKQGERKTAVSQDRAATLSADGVRERGDQLKLTSPRAGETLLLNLAGGEKVDLAWVPLAPGTVVTVEYGSTRGHLSAFDQTFSGDGGRGRLSLKPGKWFVRLVARTPDGTELASLVTPFDLEPRAAPALIDPPADADLVGTANETPVHFRWVDRNPFTSQVFEIATEPRFKNIIHRANLDADEDEHDHPLPRGTYYWRVTGFTKGAALASTASKVRVVTALDERANLREPVDGATFTAAAVLGGLEFTWRGSPGKSYALTLKTESGNEVFVTESTNGSARAPTVPAGAYEWVVRSAAGVTNPFHFRVTEAPRLAWTDDRTAFEYAGDAAAFDVGWTKVAGAGSYRYQITADGEAPRADAWLSTKKTALTETVPRDGVYGVAVEALDLNGGVLAAAPSRVIKVSRRAPIAAPIWTTDAKSFVADPRGGVTFGWNAVEGARTYVLTIRDQRGLVTERTVPRGPASLKHLKPGSYRVRVRAVDEFKRPGATSEERPLEVPNASDISAPKLRAVKVR